MTRSQPLQARTAALIPVLNEAPTITEIVDRVRRHVSTVIVVDDGSTDDTGRLAAASGARVLRHPENRGKGAALQTGLAWLRDHPEVEFTVLLDGDGQHDSGDVPRMLGRLVSDGLDILVGSRFLGENNAPLYRLFGLHVLSAAAALGSGVRLTDSQSGYRVLSRRAVERMRLTQKRFAVESEMQFEAAAHRLRVAELPIQIRYEAPARRSPVEHGVSVLLATIGMTVRRRPARLPLLLVAPYVAFRISRTHRNLMAGESSPSRGSGSG